MDVVRTVAGTIRWDTIRAITGDCANVPNALSLLQSDDPITRKSAYWMLDNHIVVQGGLFEGSFFAVPFLLQICNKVSTYGRIEALTLLYEIAAGVSAFENQVKYTTIGDPFVYYEPASTSIGIPLVIAVRLAIACGLRVVASIMGSDNEVERKKTRELLLLFPEYASVISDILIPIAEKISNQQIRKEIFSLTNELRH